MRPEILFPLFAPITSLKGVASRNGPLLERVAGGALVRDVLFTAPQSLVRRRLTTVAQAQADQVQTLVVIVNDHQKPGRPSQPWKIRCRDDTGFISLVWFKGHGPHLEQRYPVGAHLAVSGKVERSEFDLGLQIVHPDYMIAATLAPTIPEVEAIYPATAGLPSRSVRRFALEALERAPQLPEWQDPAWLAKQGWPSWREAIGALHAPEAEPDLSLDAP
ncbi:MAG TPA: OB-fold nucleic acid binding domain-containing protein, partial [Caulobacteraceae bacterium]